MIFDRTLDDVTNAISIKNNYLQKGISLTEEQIDIMERGMLTINTLNRIEEKQKEIYEKLLELGFSCKPITTKLWLYEDIFTESDFKRICNNTNELEKAVSILPTRIELKYDYIQINAIEKALHDLESVIQ